MDRSCPKRIEFNRSRQQASKPKPPMRKASKRTPTVPVFTTADFTPLPDAVPADRQEDKLKPPVWKADKQSPAIPVCTTADYPPLSGAVPADRQEYKSSRPAAEAGSSQGNNIDPRAGATSKKEGEALYSSAELWSIFIEFSTRLKKCKTCSDQVNVVSYVVCKYGAK